jgi:hypothetical protein
MALFTRQTATPTPEPRPTLDELEAVISAGLETIEHVGNALLTIRTRKLYRDGYETFETYLNERWKMSVDYCKKLVDAATLCKEIRSVGLPAPTREAHARELRKVPTDKRSEAWQETLAAAGGDPANVTAEQVAKIAAKHRKTKARRKAPKTIVLKGKGWTIRLERKSVDVDAAAALTEALTKLSANVATKLAA